MKSPIYLDYAATTPADQRVIKEMNVYQNGTFGNASSLHQFGFDALAAVDAAKDSLARALECKPSEIIFTSGATESSNMAILGTVLAAHKNLSPKKGKRSHIITSAIEHHSVLHVCEYLEHQGFSVTYLQPTKEGRVEPEALEQHITNNTLLVSVMCVNNEIGTIQPIRALARITKKYGAIFHTDAAQALQYEDCRVDRLGVDLMSLSAHKVYGPKGVGALYMRKGTSIDPVLHGGEQEYGIRPGTYNTPGIVGFGKATEILCDTKEQERGRVILLRDQLISTILATIPGTELNGSTEHRIANNVNILIKDIDAESLIIKLDMDGFAISAGSACAAGSNTPSHVLQALYSKQGDTRAGSSIRITLGRDTTERHTILFVKALQRNTEALRAS
jgi:cysteine desulfurase